MYASGLLLSYLLLLDLVPTCRGQARKQQEEQYPRANQSIIAMQLTLALPCPRSELTTIVER